MPLRVRPARTVYGRVVPLGRGASRAGEGIRIEADWYDKTFGECTTNGVTQEDGSYAIRVPADAPHFHVCVPPRTWKEFAAERSKLIDALIDAGADYDAVDDAWHSVRGVHPGYHVHCTQGADGVRLYLPQSHTLTYTVTVDGRLAMTDEVSVSMERVGGWRDGLYARPHCTRWQAVGLATGEYKLTVSSMAKVDDAPLFSETIHVAVPGPPVEVHCYRPRDRLDLPR